MNDRQLELGLGIARKCRSRHMRKSRYHRGHEWFERMRRVVERAPDRKFEADKRRNGPDQFLQLAA